MCRTAPETLPTHGSLDSNCGADLPNLPNLPRPPLRGHILCVTFRAGKEVTWADTTNKAIREEELETLEVEELAEELSLVMQEGRDEAGLEARPPGLHGRQGHSVGPSGPPSFGRRRSVGRWGGWLPFSASGATRVSTSALLACLGRLTPLVCAGSRTPT